MSLENVKRERKMMRGSITRLCGNLTVDRINTLDKDTIEANKLQVDQFRSKMKQIDEFYLAMVIDSKTDEELDEICESVDKYGCMLNALQACLDSKLTLISNDSFSSRVDHAYNCRPPKLPDIKFPIFYANELKDTDTCETFFKKFESRIKDQNLADDTKYHYLEQCLKDRALAMVASLSFSEQSYTIAKNRLLHAFAETVPQQFAAINKLIYLKFKNDPFIYFSEFKGLVDNLKDLKVDTNTLFQYYIWQGLPLEVQDHLVNITGKSFPSYVEIEKISNIACNRYLAHRAKSVSNSVNVSNNAVALVTDDTTSKFGKSFKPKKSFSRTFDRKKWPCKFCTSTEHYDSGCTIYQSAVEKLKRIKELNLCTNCLKSGHNFKTCNYVLARTCKNCDMGHRHWDFLCTINKVKDGLKTNSRQNEKSLKNFESQKESALSNI